MRPPAAMRRSRSPSSWVSRGHAHVRTAPGAIRLFAADSVRVQNHPTISQNSPTSWDRRRPTLASQGSLERPDRPVRNKRELRVTGSNGPRPRIEVCPFGRGERAADVPRPAAAAFVSTSHAPRQALLRRCVQTRQPYRAMSERHARDLLRGKAGQRGGGMVQLSPGANVQEGVGARQMKLTSTDSSFCTLSASLAPGLLRKR